MNATARVLAHGDLSALERLFWAWPGPGPYLLIGLAVLSLVLLGVGLVWTRRAHEGTGSLGTVGLLLVGSAALSAAAAGPGVDAAALEGLAAYVDRCPDRPLTILEDDRPDVVIVRCGGAGLEVGRAHEVDRATYERFERIMVAAWAAEQGADR